MQVYIFLIDRCDIIVYIGALPNGGFGIECLIILTKIIYTKDEATFIQNMLFTLERTYRTTDFGVWEFGSRHENIRELNASSIGMAKAALEAANGLNIMGINVYSNFKRPTLFVFYTPIQMLIPETLLS